MAKFLNSTLSQHPTFPQIPHEIPNPTHCQPQPLLTRKRQQKAPLAGGRKAAETVALELPSSNREKSASVRRGPNRALHHVSIISACWNYGPSIGRRTPQSWQSGKGVFKTQFNNSSKLANRFHLSEEAAPNYLPSIGRAPNAAASFPSCFLLQIQHIGITLH